MSWIALTYPARREHVGDPLPPRVGRQRTCVPTEQLRDGPVVEFDFRLTAFGTDIGANHGGGKRFRPLTCARKLGYSWIGWWEESFSFVAAAFSIGVPRPGRTPGNDQLVDSR